MPLGITVTHFACTVQRLACSRRPTKKASPTSCNAFTTIPWNFRSVWIPCATSLTSLWNGSHLISNCVLLWYLLISFNALIPCLVFTPSFFHFPSPVLFSLPLACHHPCLPCILPLYFSLFHPLWGFFTLHAISSNRDRFYVTTSISNLRLTITT